MEGFDHGSVFFSDNFNSDNNDQSGKHVLQVFKKKFKDFLRQFHECNFNFKYRDALKRNYNQRKFFLEVNLEDLAAYDEASAEKIFKQPTEYLPVFEEAAKELADELTKPRPIGEENVEDIQILLNSDANCIPMRGMKPDTVSKLIKISGIIISATGIRAKATKIAIQCRSCRNVIPNIPIRPGLEGYPMPRQCTTEKCPDIPNFMLIVICVTEWFQEIEMLVEIKLLLVFGHPIFVLLAYKLMESTLVVVRIKFYFIFLLTCIESKHYCDMVLGTHPPVTSEEEEQFRRLAADPNLYDRITRSIAPSIYGAVDMKKAIACLLFGGSRKKMPDGLCRRGDINILMLGDPGTAKSQLLKFVENVSPVGVYTSGKGSSAAGLTASVMRDPSTRNFVMEGGAMVLADGGVVCIDEFDKMREDDRVAIHEAMEQQTISIAKAGITTTLNTRCSVLAAANSVFGRWEDSKGEDNINFMPTILSRFDMIFIVKDDHNVEKDITLAKHVLNLHANAQAVDDSNAPVGELSVPLLKKYIHYCRVKCGPRLTLEAGEKLKNRYVMMRSLAGKAEKEEAIIRISESIAKMSLLPFATETHVDEALRLFQVSTISAASSGSLAGAEGFISEEDHDMLTRIEKNLKKRFAIGTQVSQKNIINDFVKQQKYPEQAILKVIYAMIKRGELQHRQQRKMLYRMY
ncbi:unnamed protein product [Trichogramma brassicae]|uniref:DNA replication licensing factor MCM5 n=1 Tax=Trichogramma brassicae TaxID=86971 RepID=A0A6H5I355_9HYME|nr:unnamed protein product [Trichogramma brassicae]